LMQNLGGGRFRNVGLEAGAAFGSMGQDQAGMGTDWADYDRDGRFDFAVSAFSGEAYSLYHNVGRIFEHAGPATGIAEATQSALGFGVKFTDADNDGWKDLVFVNGHVYDNVAQVEPGSTYKQPSMLFLNRGGARFELATASAGPDFGRPILGRGLATGDYNNDGREDLLVVDYEGQVLLLKNESRAPHHWLTLDLRSSGKNRLGYGARAEVRAGSTRWVGQVSPASAYLSSSDPRIHFGLGAVTEVDSVQVTWPDGTRQELLRPPVDRIHRVQQAASAPAP
ncbi:MAG TPA: CRTAC1 family protein, partial [Armatimonadota bacterium]|nr:CRTAC1 family protein [Armatimonadota bacterium]